SSVVVFKTFDVIYTELVAALHLHQDHVLVAAVFQTILDALGNVGGLVGEELVAFIAATDGIHDVHHHPVHAAMVMQLQRKRTPRLDDDALDLKATVVGEAFIGTPGPEHLAVQHGFAATESLQFLHDVLDLLHARLVGDQYGIGS